MRSGAECLACRQPLDRSPGAVTRPPVAGLLRLSPPVPGGHSSSSSWTWGSAGATRHPPLRRRLPPRNTSSAPQCSGTQPSDLTCAAPHVKLYGAPVLLRTPHSVAWISFRWGVGMIGRSGLGVGRYPAAAGRKPAKGVGRYPLGQRRQRPLRDRYATVTPTGGHSRFLSPAGRHAPARGRKPAKFISDATFGPSATPLISTPAPILLGARLARAFDRY